MTHRASDVGDRPSPRKQYARPELIEYGPVEKLTQGPSTTSHETGSTKKAGA